MRVLYVNHTSLVSGAERSLLTLLCAVDREEVAGLACPPGPLAQRAAGLGVPVHEIAGTTGSFQLHPRRTAIAVAEMARMGLQLRRIARRAAADLLHANSVRAGLAGAIARDEGRLPLVVHVRDCLPDSRAGRAVRGVLCARSDRLIAISRYVEAGFAGREPSPSLRGKLRVLENPVDLSRFESRQRNGGAERAATLAIIGQITRWKGHDTIVKALRSVRARFPEVRLQVVGEVKFVDASTRLDNRGFLVELERLVEELGLSDAVQFLGEREDVPQIMAAAAAVLVPSIEEPFGRTVAEAMAIGTPVIATTVGGPAELIEDGVSGTLAPPGDPEAWAEAIARLLGDPQRAQRMAKRASEQARRRFDVTAHVAALSEIYAQLSAGPGR